MEMEPNMCRCSILLVGSEEPHLAISSGTALNIFYNMSASTTDIFSASSFTKPYPPCFTSYYIILTYHTYYNSTIHISEI